MGNILRGNEDGFDTFGLDNANHRVIGNLFADNESRGMSLLDGVGHVVRANVATGNRFVGFAIAGRQTITGNIATANGRGFILAAAAKTVLTKNAAHSNTIAGLVIQPIEDECCDSFRDLSDGLVIHRNSFYGNNPVVIHGTVNTVNCGFVHRLVNVPSTIDARNNYWGAATGPGSDPAGGTGSTLGEPFARQEFDIPTPKGW
jgi:parallel beta-helix repeat protein